MVVDFRARMSKFVFCILEIVVKKCKTAMLIKEIDISRLMTHAQKIEKDKLKKKARDTKRERTYSDDYSHQSPNNGDHSQFQKKFSSPTASSAPVQKCNKDRLSNPKPEKSVPSGHTFLLAKTHQGTSYGSNFQHHNGSYALQTRKDQEDSLKIVMGILGVFQFDVYTLLDPRDNLSFATPYVSMKFDIMPLKRMASQRNIDNAKIPQSEDVSRQLKVHEKNYLTHDLKLGKANMVGDALSQKSRAWVSWLS
ncbi:uncharacterized protein LOC129875613 [Solanum dulcamara]|uniref:uncharacterized protein LOC129875613 n=1 Tax=Solanum dulcamara TaxID=45834 RepID=UPI002486765C|nr:uncharacterized protein LOC129875613 [Solanum dulcamara]